MAYRPSKAASLIRDPVRPASASGLAVPPGVWPNRRMITSAGFEKGAALAVGGVVWAALAVALGGVAYLGLQIQALGILLRTALGTENLVLAMGVGFGALLLYSVAGGMIATSGDEAFVMLTQFPGTAAVLFALLFVAGIIFACVECPLSYHPTGPGNQQSQYAGDHIRAAPPCS